jgi:hypothetical protein
VTDAGIMVARRVPLAVERTLAQAGVYLLLARSSPPGRAHGHRPRPDLSVSILPAALKNADAAAALWPTTSPPASGR